MSMAKDIPADMESATDKERNDMVNVCLLPLEQSDSEQQVRSVHQQVSGAKTDGNFEKPFENLKMAARMLSFHGTSEKNSEKAA